MRTWAMSACIDTTHDVQSMTLHASVPDRHFTALERARGWRKLLRFDHLAFIAGESECPLKEHHPSALLSRIVSHWKLREKRNLVKTMRYWNRPSCFISEPGYNHQTSVLHLSWTLILTKNHQWWQWSRYAVLDFSLVMKSFYKKGFLAWFGCLMLLDNAWCETFLNPYKHAKSTTKQKITKQKHPKLSVPKRAVKKKTDKYKTVACHFPLTFPLISPAARRDT